MMKRQNILMISLIFAGCLSFLSACNFLEPDAPESQISRDLVFADDQSAIAAITGVYQTLYTEGSFASGTERSIVALTGLSADELQDNRLTDFQTIAFEQNDLRPENDYVLQLWSTMYKAIYQANAVIESLQKSSGVTTATRKRLQGEALFIRAFCHFYLVNCFGNVPLILTTDYEVNARVSRTDKDLVYDQITEDLVAAESLLPEDYSSTSYRIRVNKFSATAMLARVYLFTQDFQRAEDKATNVINQSSRYTVHSNLNAVFLNTSSEAIWQLKPADAAFYTFEGYYFGTDQGPGYNVIREAVVNLYEPGDKRRTNWITSVTKNAVLRYLPWKYKQQYFNTPNPNEFSMVLRLAEQYLIRAEARLAQHKRELAIADVDVIRARAGIPLIQNTNPAITEDALLLAIQKEKQLEFLAEWGHRWFDLKRWDIANSVLGPIKTEWSEDDQLYPIPSRDIIRNRNLEPQNPGY